jgi:hypothetical protein
MLTGQLDKTIGEGSGDVSAARALKFLLIRHGTLY